MTKAEAKEAMKAGKQVTHRYFSPNEWVKSNPSGTTYTLEDGVQCSSNEFWAYRTQNDYEMDWELWLAPHHFSAAEIDNYKNGSLKVPLVIYEGTDETHVVEVTELISMGGMATNGGIPTVLRFYQHRKDKDGTVQTKTLTYNLEE